ncbi:MAG: type IV toxin-antitoxin system AbiEi family antitoxin domain-containing protein [Actinomycetota bacterium]|nr:type IV toxin-antitoxin system AbiEi family antitoxin domain-containing protein [Actinomycetota bacterium]
MDLERRLMTFVAARYGIVTRAEAADLGYSISAIDRRTKQGLWIPVFRGIYRVAAVPQCFEQDVLAATIVAHGAAAMRAAVRLHGLHGYTEAWWRRSARPHGGQTRAGSSFITLINSPLETLFGSVQSS